MRISEIVSAARRAFTSLSPSAPPRGEEPISPEEGMSEVRSVREQLGKVAAARQTHGVTVARRNAAADDLAKVTADLDAVRTTIAAREKEIALSGAELPDEPLPEDAEIARLERHVRIRRESLRAREAEVSSSQAAIDGELQSLNATWRVLGSAVSKLMAENFRSAAIELWKAQTGYRSLLHHFGAEWDFCQWKGFHKDLIIGDPLDRSHLIIHPLRDQLAKNWPPEVQELSKVIGSLKTEINEAKGRLPL